MDEKTIKHIADLMAQARNNLLLFAAHNGKTGEAFALNMAKGVERMARSLSEEMQVPIAAPAKAGGPCPHVCHNGERLDFETGACVEC